MLITSRHNMFLPNVAYICMLYCLTTSMHTYLFDGQGFANHQSGWLWSVSENDYISTLESHGIFRSNLHTYLF